MTSDEEIKARMQAHRVYYVIGWDLPEDEKGSHAYITDDPNAAKRIVTDRLKSGLPVQYRFLRDEHDFGGDMVASVGQSLPWDQTPAEVLRMVADQLDEQELNDEEEDTPTDSR
jgi:hypothetical protein